MKLRHLTFRLLEVYVSVVRHGSISEAARQLHLTQPTVSLQLKRLSEAVGEPLLEHTRGQLHLTDAGQVLYRACQDMLGRFDDLQDNLLELKGGHSGRFSIAMVNTAQYVMPRLLGPFSQDYPEVDVTVEIGNREQVLHRFHQQLDDIYIFSHPPSLEHAAAARFLRNPLIMIAAEEHPLAGADEISLPRLLEERFLLREPGSATRMLFDSWLQTRGLQLHRSLQMASNEAIRVGVAAGMGVAVVSQHVLPKGLTGIVPLQVEGMPLESHWHFIVRRDRRLPYAARRFLIHADDHLESCLDPAYVCHETRQLLAQLGIS
ncbi:LysR family transcriptional regulator [Nitrincola alkalilacustris]|uniref:LysR family transcriptional regulator n=1 Tax=Nitrincola alkalilacustris TaxID=1571224 RepID=UPI00124E277F|nr:LysR family transcriptional regulator [Nitrincola alkalilacustris]